MTNIERLYIYAALLNTVFALRRKRDVVDDKITLKSGSCSIECSITFKRCRMASYMS